MPGAGFKKGLFGFNREDVIRYIEQLQKKNNQTEQALKSEMEELQHKFDELKLKNEQLSADLETSYEKMKSFEEKQEEIERLSQGIGTLYLVAKTNAEQMMNHAVKGSHAVMAETNKNLKAIETTQDSLLELKTKVESTSTAFSKEVAELLNSLKATREKIEDDSKALKTSEDTLSSLVKESSLL